MAANNIDSPSHVVSQHRKTDLSPNLLQAFQEHITLIKSPLEWSQTAAQPTSVSKEPSPAHQSSATSPLRRSTAPSYSDLSDSGDGKRLITITPFFQRFLSAKRGRSQLKNEYAQVRALPCPDIIGLMRTMPRVLKGLTLEKQPS